MRLLRSSFFSVFIIFIFALGSVSAADLTTARPEKVGMSSQRLERLTAAMKELVDRGELSGVVTMVAKDNRVVHFEATGRQDVNTGEPMKKDSITDQALITGAVMPAPGSGSILSTSLSWSV